MKNINEIKNYIAEQNKSDSGDPLVTGLIIIGVMAVVALAIYLAFGNALADRGDEVATDIQDSGSEDQLGGNSRDNVEFNQDSQNSN